MLNRKGHKDGNIPLFIHFSVFGSSLPNGQPMNLFDEVAFDNDVLHKYFNPVICGHVHDALETSDINNKTLIAGSIFNEETGEDGKNVYIFDTDKLFIETIKLPGRGIYKLINPSQNDIYQIDSHSIVKVFITERGPDLDLIRTALSKFDGYVIVEQYPNERRMKNNNDLIDLNIENLLLRYAHNKNIEPDILIEAWNKIK